MELPLVAEDETATAQGRRIAETIVRPNARPVLTVRDNRATTEFLGPDSQVWAQRILAAQAGLDRVIPAVGRVEVNNNPDYTWVGTGWLVAEDILVTNRHVAREFGRLSGRGFIFRPGINGGPMTARIDFLEEDQRQTSLEYGLTQILWIAPPAEPDVAFLRVTRAAGDRPLPPFVVLAEEVAEDLFVATIGYPARDSRVPDQDLVRQIFGDVYDKKRLAPGQVIEVRPDELEHDCSTLGGNSGSLLVDLRTAEAVGLHFSGLFLEANFAVPAPKIRNLLRRVQQGELPGATSLRSAAPPPPPPLQATAPGTYTFQMQIPIEITVKVGGAILPGGSAPISAGVIAGDSYENALRAARETLAGNPDVLEVRLGYRFKRGWITDEKVVVVELREKKPAAEVLAEGKPLIPPQILGVGVDVRTAALADQLEHLGVDLAALTERARPGRYREPPDLSLERLRERMRAIFHVSPDSGFPNLKAFLGRVERNLTATMFEWEAEHISSALAAAMAPDGNTLRMVTQKSGTRGAVEDMKTRIGRKLKHVWASVGDGKLIPSSYHIKVASRDGEEVWLSSGNWKDSNQADIDPAGEGETSITPLRQHNREWHAIIANRKLATLFQKYIEFDFEEAQRVPLEEAIEVALPDLFIPESAFLEEAERAVRARYFKPLVLDRELDVQPLLTPDRDSRGNRLFMATAISMIKEATRKVYVENQSFNLLDDNNDEFEAFFGVLRDKQEAGLDVRIIFRDAREFGGSNAAKQQKLLERLKDFGLDTDAIRVQKRCHTKGIVVDTAAVMIGSHNLTNEGSLFNRDASLLIRDAEVAEYFEKIFRFDWETLATQEADELVGGMRLARAGEETPRGFRRVSLAEVFGDS
ncbi:MAG: phospholipase D-like domain-containing protein [Thermoanaerobaculia bacterium]